MAIANFTPLPTLPTPPNTQTDTKPIFLQKADAFNPALKGWADNFNSGTVPTLNDLIALLNQQLPYINTVADSDKAIRAIYADLSSIISVSEGIDSVQTVAEQISGVKDIADNLTEVLAAKGYAEDAKKWALIAESVANIGPATPEKIGLVKPDAVTTHITEDGTITAKDVAIGGDLGDLASARGQVGDAKEMPNLDFNTLTTPGNYRITGNPTNGPSLPLNISGASIGSLIVAGIPGRNGRIFQIMISGSAITWRTIQDSTGTKWSAWQQLLSGNKVGDGIRTTQGIISVPEYEGATASKAGTSGLVPPAAAGQHESFLTGGGEYKPALSTGGGVMTGSVQINDPANVIGLAPSTNTERGLFLGDKNSVIMGGFDVIQRASDNAKYTQFYSKNSSGHITSIAAVTYEDGTRELVADSPLQINDIQIKQVVDGGRRVIVLSGARGKEGYSFRFSPDTGEAYMDGRVIHAKADTAGYADTAGSAPANGGTAWAANRLRREGGVDTVWNWAGQGGQPGWLWGGNDGVNMYVYNPANFSVNYANSAGSAPANGGTAWAVTVTPNVVNVSRSALPAGGTWLVMSLDNGDGGQFQKLNFSKVAGGTRTSGLAIRIA